MKKLVASVGLVALGTSIVQSASAQGLQGPDANKPWSISATLRGFYDDNVSSTPNDVDAEAVFGQSRDSFGFEVAPSVSYVISREATAVSLSYLGSFKWYENTPIGNTDKWDKSHTFNAALSHAFSPRYQIAVRDSFVIGQEPDLLRTGNSFSSFQRIPGDNIRNFGGITLDAQLTPVFGATVGYNNTYYNYDDENVIEDGLGNITPSLSGQLDRIEHSPFIEGNYQIQPQTKGLLGYQFRWVDYTADEPISGNVFFPETIHNADFRNSYSHYLYAGLEHNFRPDLVGKLRAGAQVVDFYNMDSDTDISPYVRGSLQYTYAPQSYIEGGIAYERIPVDIVSPDSFGDITKDAETFTVFASLNHRITPKLTGRLLGQFQNSLYQGGAYDNKNDQIYLVGLEFEYRINQFLAANAGYNYDLLNSDIPFREYDRNRVYLGLTARY